ncbi:MAG: lytic transglycosylase domain-containing protein [Desulfobacterales bacterium]|nr:MAG: lytic transglycosylase domain-containing protein [Desulfobacterales bacterium]
MNQIHIITKLIICMVLMGYGQQVAGAVKDAGTDIEARWHHFLVNDALKFPIISFPYGHCFKSAAEKYDLPLSLLLAVARGESNFNPQAKSDRNCHGLMQIQWPGTAKHLGIRRLKSLYEPCTNIRAGARYLRELMDRYNQNLHLALAAYNYGPNRIQQKAGPDHIPQGAQWYSGYIYHHMQYVTQGGSTASGAGKADKGAAYGHEKRLAIITFNQPYRASAFYQHLHKQAPSLNLDWYRIGLGRYQVVMLYTDKKALEAGRKKLRNIGVIVNGR